MRRIFSFALFLNAALSGGRGSRRADKSLPVPSSRLSRSFALPGIGHPKNPLRCCLFPVWLTLLLVCSQVASADDWPQWLGPNRDGVWHEKGIVTKFPEKGLPVKWKAPVNLGYSGPAVANGRVYVTDYARDAGDTGNDPGTRKELSGKERILCLNAETGKIVWEHSYPCKYNISYPSGPRATPTVQGGKVYTLGSEGDLVCLDANDGKVVWTKELKSEYKVQTPIWGFCAAPLVDGKKLICLVGGENSVVVAFDKDTGKEIWKALSAEEPGYSPPSIIQAGGVRQLIVWHTEAINGLNPETGEVYWSKPLKPEYGMSIMIPQKHGDYLFASGIGNIGALLKLDATKPTAEIVWRGRNDNAVYAANSTPIIDETGTMYGADCQKGQLRAVDLKTGDRLWETFAPTTGTRRGGHGTAYIIRNGNRYVLFSETGDLILANLSAKAYDEISRFHLIDPTGECFGRDVVWSYPAFANKCVYARNDKEIVCVSLAAE